ncbi:unnamed protein product, partial [Candidula unifasciata]
MKIRIDNISDGETVIYSTPLLTGQVEGNHVDGSLQVSLSSEPKGVISWPVIDGHFKVLVRLQPGENTVKLQFNQESLSLRLVYEIPGFSHIVRPVYLVCADDDGYFQGPENIDCSPTSAIKRISFGAEIIQSLTAEKMKEHGFGRSTFQLDMDSDNLPVCHVFKSKLRLEEAYSMTGYLWSYFGKELITSPLFPHKSRSKFYCFMSFTRYHLPKDEDLPKTHSDILRHTKGHTALGGGGLALFGTGNLHTWAESLATFNSCLTNRTRMDRKRFMDDSAYREYYWANYATGLGASLHELGHTFDLAHTPSGIMARGFDDLHKICTVPDRSYIVQPPLVVGVESGFKPATLPTTLNVSVKNYDGSETRHTVLEGMEVCRIRNRCSTSAATSTTSMSPIPSKLPSSPDESSSTSAGTVRPEVICLTGAHWHRSSAVVLRFHKWFNKPNPNDARKNPALHGACIRTQSGLRVVELRTEPEGSVFHHREFLGSNPPSEFKLCRSEVSNLPAGTTTVTVMAEDSFGNIMKKKFPVKDFL